MKRLLSALLLMPTLVHAQSLVITTVAGTHVAGYSGNGGPALSANLYQPNQLAIDTAGNIYIAETGSHVVRKVGTDGIITVVAGIHSPGYSGNGGLATSAQLNMPSSVCLDRAGNLYIAELGNACVRKVNTSGMISTYAGIGSPGYSGDSSAASSAALNGPFGIICDTANNLYITDGYNSRVRKVDASTGIITTIAGTGLAGSSGDGGPATAATLSTPIDVAIDKAGNIYIDDIDSSVIRKINPAGIITTAVGTGTAGYTGDGGPATAADLQYPYAIGVDTAGNLYITDNGNEVIRKVNTSGVISTIAGTGAAGYSGDGGPALSAQIMNTGGVKPDTHGNIFIADYGNNVIRKIGPALSGIAPVAVRESVAFVIAPNPAADNIQISCSQPIERIAIKDLTGRVVYSATIKESTVTVDISTLPAGVYCAVINGREVKRFVKQ